MSTPKSFKPYQEPLLEWMHFKTLDLESAVDYYGLRKRAHIISDGNYEVRENKK